MTYDYLNRDDDGIRRITIPLPFRGTIDDPQYDEEIRCQILNWEEIYLRRYHHHPLSVDNEPLFRIVFALEPEDIEIAYVELPNARTRRYTVTTIPKQWYQRDDDNVTVGYRVIPSVTELLSRIPCIPQPNIDLGRLERDVDTLKTIMQRVDMCERYMTFVINPETKEESGKYEELEEQLRRLSHHALALEDYVRSQRLKVQQ
jgi:hypothetical protein